MKFSRRSMLAAMASATAAAVVPRREAEAAVDDDAYMTLIDLSKCDGCEGRKKPACVAACRRANTHKFPQPDPSEIRDYWPQEKHEDWSDKRHLSDRLTPYNWLFVQTATVQHKGTPTRVSIPRRCMHCDNPPCVKLCPFGANKKDTNGPVHIDTNLCFGGAKCRTVCPWSVPQRQAGVGVYTYLDPMPVGGGVMYKCDLCRDRLAVGKRPACVEACPRGAMEIGPRQEIVAKAKALAAEYDGYLYGLDENGGTSTVYVSKVPFAAIDEALTAAADEPKKVMRLHQPENMLEKHDFLAASVLTAPVLGAVAAFAATVAATEKKNQPQKQGDGEDHVEQR